MIKFIIVLPMAAILVAQQFPSVAPNCTDGGKLHRRQIRSDSGRRAPVLRHPEGG